MTGAIPSLARRLYWRFLRAVGAESYSWDCQFKTGVRTRKEASPHTIEIVTQLCQGGLLVEHGCGETVLPRFLPEGTFSRYIGFDISEVAIRKAAQGAPAHCAFEQADMKTWQGENYGATLVVLQECLYYLKPAKVAAFLLRCCRNLAPDGKILVIIHDRQKHGKTAEVCRQICRVHSEKTIGRRLYLVLGPANWSK
jgi:trans-aconitate methyltransferase